MFALSLALWALTQLLKHNVNNHHHNLRHTAALPTGCWHQLLGSRREGCTSNVLVPKFKFTIFIFKAHPKVGKGLPHASEIMTSHDSYMLPRQWICQPQQRDLEGWETKISRQLGPRLWNAWRRSKPPQNSPPPHHA